MAAHTHSHTHDHAPANFDKRFSIGIALNLGVVVVEIVFGLASHSLALLSDAGHNATDVLALALAWIASVLVQRRPTSRRTYGLRRSSILAALFNAIMLIVIVGGIAYEAIGRFTHPEPIDNQVVIWVAAAGMLLNIATALLFRKNQHDINIRSAYLHMAGDAAISFGVILTGVLISFTGWLWLDPVISLGIGVVITAMTWHLLRESFNLAMDSVPAGIDPHTVEEYLFTLPGICEVHDLHIWPMSTTETALTVHLVTTDTEIDNAMLLRTCKALHDKFGIEHPTIQMEHASADHDCALRDPSRV
jgi:cobalt-zinc-cadmium efflux system protein